MADLTSRLIVRLIDGVSGPAAKAAVGLRRLMGVTEKQAMAGRGTMMAAQRDMALISRGAQRVSSSVSMPIGLLGAMGARTVYEYEKVGNAMQAVTGVSDKMRQKIEEKAVALNEKFPATLGEIMGGAFELGRAGLDAEQILGGLEGTLQLSLAGDLAIDEAADISTNILTAMRLPAKGAEEVAASLHKVNDVLAYVATNSNTDVRMMGETLKYVGPIAAAAGMSLDEVGAASMIMAKNGIRASEAGVAMRSALVRMVRPTKPMLVALERLGVSMKDFVTGGREITGKDIVGSLMGDGIDASAYEKRIDEALANPKLRKSTAAMTAAIANIIDEGGTAIDRKVLSEAITDTLTAAGSEVDFLGFIEALKAKGADLEDIARIFDARQGSRLITLLSGDLVGALKEVSEQSEGAAAKMADTRMKGIVGQVNQLVAALDKLWISIAKSGVLGTVTDALGRLTKGLDWLSTASPFMLQLGTYAGIAAVALIPLSMAFTAVAGAGSLLLGILGWIGAGIAVIGAIPAAIIAGLMLLGVAIWYFWDDIKEIASKLGEVFKKWATESVEALGRMVDYFSNLASKIGSAIAETAVDLFDAGAKLLQSLWDGMKSKFSAMVSWAGSIPSRIGGAIKGALGFGGDGGGSENLPARSRGGHVSRGRSYLVGERRPEIFTPGSSGYIHSRVPDGGRPQTITVAPVINVNGASDPVTIAEMVKREITRAIRDGLRGIHADAGAAVW